MGVSQEQFEEIIRRQLDGRLMMMIDTAEFRQFLLNADPSKIGKVIGRSVRLPHLSVKILSYADALGLVVTSGLAILAFKFWAIIIVPILVSAWGFYKGRASVGRQGLVGVSILLGLCALAAFSAPQSWSPWVRAFILAGGLTFFLVRLLYVVTSRFVFSLVESSYEFFATFYGRPGSLGIPMLWTDPPFED